MLYAQISIVIIKTATSIQFNIQSKKKVDQKNFEKKTTIWFIHLFEKD